MRFLLTFLMSKSVLPDRELNHKCFGEMMSFLAELKASRQLVFDSQVLPEPATVRVSGVDSRGDPGEPDTEFVLGGFFVIDASNHAEALAIARRCPHAQVGPVELRALDETDQNAFS